MFQKADLIKMIKEPLPRQYLRIQAKILEAINMTKGDIVICFSGGKDSALILDMYCEILSKMGIQRQLMLLGRILPMKQLKCLNMLGVYLIS